MKDAERDNIFDSLIGLSEILRKECQTICGLIDFEDDPDTVARKVGILEDDADRLMHEINYYYRDMNLYEDHEAEYLLDIVRSVEECTDDVDELSRDFVRYNVTELRDNSIASILNTEKAATKLLEIFFQMKNMNSVNSPFMDILELDHFKVESSKHYDVHMAKLFANEKDPIEIIKWKDIYSSIRQVFITFESIAENCAKYVISKS